METVCYLVIEVLVDKKKTGKSFAEMILFCTLPIIQQGLPRRRTLPDVQS